MKSTRLNRYFSALLFSSPRFSNLCSPILFSHAPSYAYSTITKELITPLVKQFINEIKIHGPMTVSQYMQQCLSHPVYGYYMRKHVFGQHGDFVTSPEVSQLFGESVAVWFMTAWLSMKNQPQSIQIVELGPGRGTLLADIIRSLSSFKQFNFNGVLKRILLIETSPELRETQLRSILSAQSNIQIQNEYRQKTLNLLDRVILSNNIEVVWYENVLDISQDDFTFLIAHEFLDALPIAQLKKTGRGWREVVIDLDESQSSPFHFQFALMPFVTPTVIAFHETMEQYKFDSKTYPDNFCVDFSPRSIQSVQHISDLIRKCGGCGLIIDYGHDSDTQSSSMLNQSSFRAISKHQFVPILSNPGYCDLTADVNFALLKRAANHSHSGIEHRARLLLKRNNLDLAMKQNIRTSMTRLMSSKQMGVVYKVMAITHHSFYTCSQGLVGFCGASTT